MVGSSELRLLIRENQANKSAGPKEANNSAGTQANDDQGANSEETYLHDEHFVLPIWSAYSTTIKSSCEKIEKNSDFKTCEKPVSQVEQIFQEELEKLKRQEKKANDAARKEATHENQDANTNNINLLNVFSTLISTVGPSIALNDDEPLYPDDPSMPHLEDIYASLNEGIFTDSSYDDEGVVTDFNNLETTVIFSPIPTTRIHTIHPKTQILRDPLSAVQTRSKVHKNFEAHALVSYIQKQQRNNHKYFQHCLFACFLSQIEPKKIFQALEDESWVDVMQEELLQFKILKKEDGIFISQDKYVAEILKKFDFLSLKTASTPIDTRKPLVKDEEAADVDVYLYRSMIGSLMYLTASRPDIMFAVCACSRFQIQNQLLDYGFNLMNTKIYIDIESTICIIKNHVFHSKTKYIEIQHHFIRDAYEKKLIQVLKIHTDDNIADLLTKAFDVSKFKFLVVNIGVTPLFWSSNSSSGTRTRAASSTLPGSALSLSTLLVNSWVPSDLEMIMLQKIKGYRDYQIGIVMISRVYYVEGLGHNVFLVGQFCDFDLAVAFRKHTCYVRDIKGVDLLKGPRGSNLYTMSLEEMMQSSLIHLLSKASNTKSWLWH
nr:retrotransposon protein, putative, unclassified [Tanacetum cinerariifolium]